MEIRFWRPSDLWEEVKEAWRSHMKSGSLVGGRIGKHTVKVEAFERAVADLHHYEHAVAFGSCSTAMAAYIGHYPAQGICSPAFTYYGIKTVSGVTGKALHCHDIDPERWTFDAPSRRVDDGHPWNQLHVPAVMFGVVPKRWKKGRNVLLDAAHGFGQDMKGLDAVLSFSAGKPVTAIEGGILLTNDEHVASYMRDIRFKFSRMDELRASYGLACVDLWPKIEKEQKERDLRYRTALKGVQVQAGDWHYLTVVRVPLRDKVHEALSREGIETVKYYESLDKTCKEATSLGKECLALPCYYGFPREQQERVIEEFNRVTE